MDSQTFAASTLQHHLVQLLAALAAWSVNDHQWSKSLLFWKIPDESRLHNDVFKDSLSTTRYMMERFENIKESL